MAQNESSGLGLVFGLVAFFSWGLLPLFWIELKHVDPLEVLAQRIVWSTFFIGLALVALRKWGWVRKALESPRLLFRYSSSALLLGFNWWLYIWSVSNGYVIESSLGYYMAPLVTVLLGAWLFGERPRPGQWGAVALGLFGVLYLSLQYGSFPWVGMLLGMTFAAYGVVKKEGRLDALEGVAFESFVLSPFALVAIIIFWINGTGAFGHLGWQTDFLLLLAGVVTQVPQVFFSAAITRLSLTVLGLLNYVAPTTSFLLGVFYFREPFSLTDLFGYLFIWVALVVFTIEGIVQHQKTSRLVKSE